MPYDKVDENGIIISKDKFIKIIKIIPISYDLKSDLEKKAILESYKLFLRTCNFDIQILIQSRKEDISKNINIIQNENDEIIDNLKTNYIEYIKQLNSKRELVSKNFFILISFPKENVNKQLNNINNIKNKFNENILKLSDTLSKCGNKILEISDKSEVIEIFELFFNPYRKK